MLTDFFSKILNCQNPWKFIVHFTILSAQSTLPPFLQLLNVNHLDIIMCELFSMLLAMQLWYCPVQKEGLLYAQVTKVVMKWLEDRQVCHSFHYKHSSISATANLPNSLKWMICYSLHCQNFCTVQYIGKNWLHSGFLVRVLYKLAQSYMSTVPQLKIYIQITLWF